MKLNFENSVVNDMIRTRPELRFMFKASNESPTMMQTGLGHKQSQPLTFSNNPIASQSKAFNTMRFMLNRIGGN